MLMNYGINGKRIEERLKSLAEIGKTDEGGVYRMALSEEDRRAQELVAMWMIEAGMQVRRDHFGNLIGRKEGNDPHSSVVMIGSHIDSVPNGGRFDGTIGVIGGIEAVQIMHEHAVNHSNPIEVVAFCDEEGARFLGGFFGSKGMVGKVTNEELQKKDVNGISRFDALKSFGLDPDNYRQSIRTAQEIKLYIEMHIEQGPHLDFTNLPIGIVTGSAGPTWLKFKLTGEAGHAGTVPMKMRRDPLVGAAEIIQAIEAICGQDPSVPTMGAVGKIVVQPGGANVIPHSVEFTVDVRDIDKSRREQAIFQIQTVLQQVCERRGLTCEMEPVMSLDPTPCAPHVIETMEMLCIQSGQPAIKMVSGAGHDAMLMADITDIGMIFVRCLEGISHNPNEWAETEDIVKGTELLLQTVLHYA